MANEFTSKLVYSLGLKTRFRGINVRQGMLFHGPAGWAEWSPFLDYRYPEISNWWQATIEAATQEFPTPVRDRVLVNVTVPAVGPELAHRIVKDSGCRTAKVKVAEPGQSFADDLARVEAVRDALGWAGKVRVDANGAWSVDDALLRLQALARFELEYAEQPVASVAELADLRKCLARRGIEILIAADESIRRSGDPERVVQADAADIAVLKVQPLGGVRRCLELAERLGLPVVVSSALESSIGLRAGLALAAALPDLPYACGLNTAALLENDVVTEPLLAVDGEIVLRELDLSEQASWIADADSSRQWEQRWAEMRESEHE